MSPILVQVSFIFAYAILAEARCRSSASACRPRSRPGARWSRAASSTRTGRFWVVLFPGLAIIFTALSLQLLGDGVRDLLDPRLRKSM